MSELTIGVDLGGTNLRVGVVSAQGALSEVVRHTLLNRSVENVVAMIERTVEESAALAGLKTLPHVGVGVAGQVEGDTVAVAPNLGWRDVPLGLMLKERLKTQVTLCNDLSAAAWGEFKLGAGRGETSVFTVFVGTGVGSAIITEGKLLKGASGVAAELGHVKIEPEGRLCGCGQRGCLEAYVGGAGLQAWMHEERLLGAPTDLEQLAKKGSGKARAMYTFVSQALGTAVANQVTMLNPGRLVLGGGVLQNALSLTQSVIDAVKSRAGARAAARVSIERAELGDDSGLIGAALLCRL